MKASPFRTLITPANHFAAASADSSRKLYVHKVVKGLVSGRSKESLSATTVNLSGENVFAQFKVD